MKESQIKIDLTDLEQRKTKISLNVGVSSKTSFIADDSNISGWRNMIDTCLETDEIREELLRTENLHLENIKEFKETWSDVDSTLTDNMQREYE